MIPEGLLLIHLMEQGTYKTHKLPICAQYMSEVEHGGESTWIM